MKAKKWIKFINRAIPNLEDQRILKEFVKKSYEDKHYGMALVFYGTGCNGKSVLTEILSEIAGRKPHDEKNGVVICEYPKTPNEYGEYLVEILDGGSTIFVASYELDITGIKDRCHVINFPNVIKRPNTHLVSDLLEEIEEIKEWFEIN